MFTSDDRDDFDDDSFLSHHKLFSPEQDQREVVHHNHHHYYHQLSLFNLPTPYHFPCFAEDHFNYDPDLIQYHQQLQQQQEQEKEQEQKQQRGEAAGDFAVNSEENEKVAAAVVEVEVEERVVVAPGRSSKKDRHSKITTARGPRDRRMRLSVEVAREFFDLQDMLGFDKASKTVEWLISQSKSAIKDIIRKVKGNSSIVASYASDCEIGFNPNSIDDDGGGRTAECPAGQKRSKRERKARQSRRRVDDNQQRSSSVTRESRMKARERARERTLEKMWKRSFEAGLSLNNPRKPCSSPLEAGEDSSCNQDQTATTGSNQEILAHYEEMAGMAGRISIAVSSSDLVCSKWSPAAASSCNLNLQEIGIPQSHQLRDCEQFFKQWEAYYNYEFDHS